VRVKMKRREPKVKQAKVKKAKTKKKKKKKTKVAEKEEQLKMSALFANAGNARKIAFAIDISGSMGHPEGSFGGMTRMDIVKTQMIGEREGVYEERG
jgi:hypothetical protein